MKQEDKEAYIAMMTAVIIAALVFEGIGWISMNLESPMTLFDFLRMQIDFVLRLRIY